MVKCVRLDLDCADICAATGRIIARQTEYDADADVVEHASHGARNHCPILAPPRCACPTGCRSPRHYSDPVRRLRSGELEGLVLDVVWDADGPMTPREVNEALRPQREMAYTTVMTILVRLCQKNLLTREPVGRGFAYRPTVSREERAASRMEEVLSAAGDRSVALAHFVESLPAEQLDDLRRMVSRSRRSR